MPNRISIRHVPVLLAALLTLRASDAAAAITPDAQRITDRYIEATGGRMALEAEGDFHVKGRLSSIGLKGTYEAWIQMPDRMVEVVSLGSIQVRTGINGDQAWRTDLSLQNLQMLGGRELESEQADVWFQTQQWLGPDQGGGSVSLASRSYAVGEAFDVLDIQPPVGPARRLWFNSNSGLLERMVVRGDLHQSQQYYSGYRKIAGRLRPTQIGEAPMADGDQAPEEGLSLDTIEVNVPMADDLFHPPAIGHGPIHWLKRDGIARLPFRYGTRHVWVRASINGAPPADFLLDTGAGLTAIDASYAAQIGLTTEGHTAVDGMGASGDAQFARVKNIRLTGANGDGVEVGDFKVGVIDLSSDLEPVMWRKVAGLIGHDFISRFVTEIDYDSLTVTFRDPTTFNYTGHGAAIPMGLAGNCPTVHATLDDGCDGEFLVDVGNSFNLNVHGSMVRRCRLFTPDRREVEVWGGGFGGSFSATVCRLSRIKLGPYEWEDPIAALSLSTHGMVGSKDYSGNIGNGILERFRCTFDYARHMLYLEPGQRYNDRDHFSRSGTLFLREGDHVLAAGITPHSGAEKAGLKPQDEILEIDGRPISRYTPEDLDRMLENGPAGSSHEIKVRRDGRDKTLTLTLSDIL
ncbi:MAG: aspartyl protease family protein [Candidatus Eiseniibacteriota bacterium]